MPVFDNRMAFKIAQGVRIFLKVEAGVTRDETPEPMHGSGALKSDGASKRGSAQLQRFKEAGNRIVRKGRAVGARAQQRTSGGESAGIRPENIVWMFATARTGTTWLSAMMDEMRGQTVWREPLVGALFGNLYYERAKHVIGIKGKHFILGGGYKNS